MEPFIGQIQIFGFNFAPRGWATCDGQLLSIAQNTALFSLLGTTFGGNGQTTFALPDLRGRMAIHYGSGPGLSNIVQGESAGSEIVTLNIANLPSHSHTAALKLGAGPGLNAAGNGGYLASNASGETIFTSVGPASDQLGGGSLTVANSGGSQGFSIRNPYLGVLHAIAMQGIYPSRN